MASSTIRINGYLLKRLSVSKVSHFKRHPKIKQIDFEMIKLRPLRLCKISSGLYGGSHVRGQLMSSSPSCHTIYRKDSKLLKLISENTFDVNKIKFGGVEK